MGYNELQTPPPNFFYHSNPKMRENYYVIIEADGKPIYGFYAGQWTDEARELFEEESGIHKEEGFSLVPEEKFAPNLKAIGKLEKLCQAYENAVNNSAFCDKRIEEIANQYIAQSKKISRLQLYQSVGKFARMSLSSNLELNQQTSQQPPLKEKEKKEVQKMESMERGEYFNTLEQDYGMNLTKIGKDYDFTRNTVRDDIDFYRNSKGLPPQIRKPGRPQKHKS